jgi:rhomboid protease GluP
MKERCLSLNENIAKGIIQKLHEVYGYEFFEINGQHGLIGTWGAALRTEGVVKALVFTSMEAAGDITTFNTGETLEELYHIFHTGFIDLTVVVFAEEETQYDYWNLGFKTIVVDYDNGKVQYYANDSIEIAEQIAGSMNHIKPQKTRRIDDTLPVVTIVLIAMNILYFLLSAALSGSILNINEEVLVLLGAKYNSGIAEGQYYRLITCMFLHGGIVHIGLNMYALYAIGPLVERVYGKVKYLLIYFIGGISASLLSYLMSPGISIGASGAIFGLMGACLVLSVKMKKRIGKSFFNNILTVIVINLVIGLSLPDIDNFGHVGGLLGGIVTAVAVFSGIDKDK